MNFSQTLVIMALIAVGACSLSPAHSAEVCRPGHLQALDHVGCLALDLPVSNSKPVPVKADVFITMITMPEITHLDFEFSPPEPWEMPWEMEELVVNPNLPK